MLENVVAWVLNNYIGEYLEDLNTDQLSVALLSGQVELENVPLKKTALRKLDLPLEVKSGILGKLTLSVPITHIRSEPWTLKLSDVLIIVGPLSGEKRYDVEAVEQVEQQRKEQMLEELELRHKTTLLDLCGVPIPQSQDSWWGASLISTVLNNIQPKNRFFHVFHVIYNKTKENSLFSNSTQRSPLPVLSRSFEPRPFPVHSSQLCHLMSGELASDRIRPHKELESRNFRFQRKLARVLLHSQFGTARLDNVGVRGGFGRQELFELYRIFNVFCHGGLGIPVYAESSQFQFFERVHAFLRLGEARLPVRVCGLHGHFLDANAAIECLAADCRVVFVSDVAREWWKFAYSRVVEESRRANANRTWEFAHERATRFNAYCRVYRKRLIAMIANPNAQPDAESTSNAAPSSNSLALVPSGQQNTPANSPSMETAIMKQIERDSQYTYHELHLFRETAFRRLLHEKEKELGITVSPVGDRDNEEPFESLDAPPPEEIQLDESASAPEPTSSGLYGWITGFFGQTEKEEKPEDNKFDFGNVDVGELKDINVKEMEGEILDVLHESWDDSTLLRRDALLAQISLRLEHLTLRFVDGDVQDGIEQQRVLALELAGVSSRWELSPKQHYVALDLTVNDMSVQRLRSGHPRPKSKLAELSESLLYSTAESTKMLLTVGRDGEDAVSSKAPIFSMHYSRKSPRLIVRHTVNCRLRPVSIVYEEGALEGLSTLFTDDPSMFEEILMKKIQLGGGGSLESDDDLVDMNITNEQISIIESHVFVNLELPAVRMEVRGRGWTKREMRAATIWEPGEPIACLNADRLNFSLTSKEQHLTSLKLAIGHVEIQDQIENTAYPLLSTASQAYQLKSLSNSCPDLHKSAQQNEAAKKSKSHHNYPPSVISSSVPDESFVAARPLTHSTMSTITSATSIDNYQLTGGAPPVTSLIASTTTTTTSSAAAALKPEVTIRLTYVDKQHLDFERKYKKSVLK
uniref:Chorein_N domain-containing protein n=1 Tax=Caenorhabditis japonica TaxID=281687 RepID=A0A8R1I955_CAEJA